MKKKGARQLVGFFISHAFDVFLPFLSEHMKKWCIYIVFLFVLVAVSSAASAQCSICTKTAQQLGDEPAKGLNAGIIYLAMSPFLVFGYIGYRWWKNNRGN